MRRWKAVGVGLGVVLAVVAVAGLWLFVRSQQAADALARSRDGVASVRAALTDGDPASARERLAVVQADTERAASLTSDPVFALASAVPYLGRTPEAVRELAATADLLAHDVLGPLVDAGEALDPATMQVGPGQIDLAGFDQALPRLEAASDGLSQARSDLSALEVSGTPAVVADAVGDLDTELVELDSQLAQATNAVRVLPPMLGRDGPRRYFLAFQSNNEARGTGGFLGSWGIVRVDDGAVTIERLGARSELDDQVYDRPPVDFGPDYEALYGDQVGSWSSANMSPHYPYAAQLWLRMWQDRTGQRLDGVITTDPVATSYLLDVTGPTTLPDGRSIDGGTFVELTESTIYALIDDDAARDAYQQVIAEAALKHVLRFAGDPAGLVDALARGAGERRVLVYSAHSDEQRLLTGMALGGALPEGPGPVAGLTVINASGNKGDYYVGQQLDYRLRGCGADTQRSRIAVTLTNAVPPGARLPLYVTQRVDLGTPSNPRPRAGGDQRVYVQVYVAQGGALESAKLDGRRVDVDQGQERGRPVYRLPVVIPAGGSVSVTFDLLEPLADGPARTWTTPLVKPAVVTADSFECEARD